MVLEIIATKIECNTWLQKMHTEILWFVEQSVNFVGPFPIYILPPARNCVVRNALVDVHRKEYGLKG